jgi:hypothetical protein
MSGTCRYFTAAFLLASTSAALADDNCLTLAEAKYAQWTQHRVLIDQTKTFADGSTKTAELLVTENTAYLQRRGIWRSRGVSFRERAVPSPAVILKGMQLGTCSKSGEVQEASQAATVYSYNYLPDDHGYVAHGKMWVSKSTGLPLREEMQDPAPPANAMVATAISATYHYNNDFEVPAGAELAESTRLFDVGQSVRQGQMGIGGGGSH